MGRPFFIFGSFCTFASLGGHYVLWVSATNPPRPRLTFYPGVAGGAPTLLHVLPAVIF
jgi:hypothetical protein